MSVNKNSLIEILREYFKNRNEIAFAFLYGSHAKGNATKSSDIDIAVYFYPKERHPIEFEKAVFYNTENEVWEYNKVRDKRRNIERWIENIVNSSIDIAKIILAYENIWNSIKRFIQETESVYKNFLGQIKEYIKKNCDLL